MSEYLKIIDGDLLEAKEQYIVHQCNCVSTGAKTLALQIFNKFPYANTYKYRQMKNFGTYSKAGTIQILGNGEDQRYIINAYSQYYPSISKYANDSEEKRLAWFKNCLNYIANIPNLESLAFPYLYGCGAAGGDWSVYYNEFIKFAEAIKKPVVLYKFEP